MATDNRKVRWAWGKEAVEAREAGKVGAMQAGQATRGAVRGWLLGIAWAGLAWAGALGAEQILPPLGPYINLRAEHFADSRSYAEGERVVLTPFFYWYDVMSGAHLWNPDGSDALTDHPPTLEGFSYRRPEWHRQELADMMAAGIDVVLPVYWGEPSQRIPGAPVSAQPWSYSGLPPLVQAREQMLSEGAEPPLIGLFYDTSTLEYNAAGRRIDLTTAYGRQWFYESVRDFFSLIPPKHWAMIEGRPIVFLYSSAFAVAHDQGCIDFLQASFARDFGGRGLYVVREISWAVSTENVYAWGGALGLKNPGVASLGPGYDHSAVPGREPLVVDREGGAFFERNWIRFLRRPSALVMIETWNEYHEGTQIAASLEYGRQYIELNRKYVEMFRAGVRPPYPRGRYSDFRRVSVDLGAENTERGLAQVESADGVTAVAEVGGVECRRVVATEHGGRYVYFRVDDSFKWREAMWVEVEVEYFDRGGGGFWVEYDGSDTNAPFNGAYTRAPKPVLLRGTGSWRTDRVQLSEARFLNGQNSGTDFRLVVETPEFEVRRVAVMRFGMPVEAGAEVAGFQEDFTESWSEEWWVPENGMELPRLRNGWVGLEADGVREVRLDLAVPTLDEPACEVLMRLRLSCEPVLGMRGGGVGFAGPERSGLSVELELRSDGVTGLVAADDEGQWAPGRAEVSWEANRWYWLRVRHTLNSATGDAVLMARLWPADGETAEPAFWALQWGYRAEQGLRAGAVGVRAPGVGAGTVLECDYVLVKADRLGERVVRLPGLKPDRPQWRRTGPVGAGGGGYELWGRPNSRYVVESSADLSRWSGVVAVTDDRGRWPWVEEGIGEAGYYRARMLE